MDVDAYKRATNKKPLKPKPRNEDIFLTEPKGFFF